jgi:hypothetical protein
MSSEHTTSHDSSSEGKAVDQNFSGESKTVNRYTALCPSLSVSDTTLVPNGLRGVLPIPFPDDPNSLVNGLKKYYQGWTIEYNNPEDFSHPFYINSSDVSQPPVLLFSKDSGFPADPYSGGASWKNIDGVEIRVHESDFGPGYTTTYAVQCNGCDYHEETCVRTSSIKEATAWALRLSNHFSNIPECWTPIEPASPNMVRCLSADGRFAVSVTQQDRSNLNPRRYDIHIRDRELTPGTLNNNLTRAAKGLGTEELFVPLHRIMQLLTPHIGTQ